MVFERFLDGKYNSDCYSFFEGEELKKAKKECNIDTVNEEIEKLEKDKERIAKKGQNWDDYIQELFIGTKDSKLRCYKELKRLIGKMHIRPETDKIKLLIEQSKKPDAILSCGTKNDKETGGIKEKSIYPCHAYSILSVNEQEGTVKVVNPWNCTQSIKLTFDEFDKNFCMINVTKVKK